MIGQPQPHRMGKKPMFIMERETCRGWPPLYVISKLNWLGFYWQVYESSVEEFANSKFDELIEEHLKGPKPKKPTEYSTLIKKSDF